MRTTIPTINKLMKKNINFFKTLIILLFSATILFSGIFLTKQTLNDSSTAEEALIQKNISLNLFDDIKSYNDFLDHNYNTGTDDRIFTHDLTPTGYTSSEIMTSYSVTKVEAILSLQATYTPHDKINISGNTDFQAQAASENWDLAGTLDGTSNKPFLIDGLHIKGNNTVKPVYIEDTTYYFVLSNNLIEDSSWDGIELDNVDNANITNNIVFNNSRNGIYIYGGSSSNYVHNNTIYENGGDGLVVSASNGNIIIDNVIHDNNASGIYYPSSDFGEIMNNTVYDNRLHGISLQSGAVSNQVESNIISDNGWYGLHFYYSQDNTVKYNNFTRDGLYLEGSTLAHYDQTDISFNTVNGKPLYIIVNQNGGAPDPDVGQIILLNSTGVEIADRTITETDVTILTAFSTNINIHDNNLVNNTGQGIIMHYTNQSTISHNEISDNAFDAIYVNSPTGGVNSFENVIEYNNIINNARRAIFLRYANNNTVQYNYMINNTWDTLALVFADYSLVQHNMIANLIANEGIIIDSSSFNTLINNSIINSHQNAMFIHSGSHNNTFIELYLDNTTLFSGITMWDSNFNVFQYIEITNMNDYGFVILRSNYTSITESNFSLNMYDGVFMHESYNATILENNFSFNMAGGFYIQDSENALITNNTAYNNTLSGIGYRRSDHNIVENNIAYNNGWDGISNWIGSDNSIINSNTVYDNFFKGIYVEDSTDVSVTNNDVYDNLHGIFIIESGTTSLVNNTMINDSLYVRGDAVNDYDLHLENNLVNNKNITFINGKIGVTVTAADDPGQVIIVDSSMVTISGLHLTNADFVVIVAFSDKVQIYNNIFESNDDYIYLQPGSENILVSWNNFVNNNLDGPAQARDEGINNTFSHNYWSDGARIDPNRDGIVEVPYQIYSTSGNYYDNFPLIHQYLGDSQLLTIPTVLSPNGGEIISNITAVVWEETISLWNSPIQYDVYISGDGGQSWQLIAIEVIGTTFFFDSNLLPDGDAYMVRVVAIDQTNGLLVEDWSNSAFTINNTANTMNNSGEGDLFGVDPVFAGGSIILLGGSGLGGLFFIRRRR